MNVTIVLITIARGIGRAPILGGYSWGFGDDWVWQFRKVGDRVHVVRRNLRFRAKANTPQAKAVVTPFTDFIHFYKADGKVISSSSCI